MDIFISPKKVVLILTRVVIVLTLLSLSGIFYKYFFFEGQERYLVNIFNLDKETNFPTWYAALSLMICSTLLLIISAAKRKSNDRYFYYWFFLGIIFLLLATDEMVQLHEQVITPIRNVLNTTGYLYITWIIPAVILGIVFLGAYFKFLIHLPRNYRILFVTSGVIYILGAIGLEIIGSNHIYYYGQKNISYDLITTVEELLEMVGVLLFIYTLLSYLCVELPNLRISFRDNDSSSAV